MADRLPGTLIVIEGIDGAGKSTLVNALGKRLQNEQPKKIVITKEPGGTTFGFSLRPLLQHNTVALAPRTEYLLFAADRAQHFYEIVIPALTNNMIVISDRMADSSLAYQGYGRGHDNETIRSINRWTMHNITPDITIYLKIPLDIAYQRIDQRKEKFSIFEEERAFMKRVADGFEALYASRTDVCTLDATMQISDVVEKAYQHIQHCLASGR